MKKIIKFLDNCSPNKIQLIVLLLLQIIFAGVTIAGPEVLRLGMNAIEFKDMALLRYSILLALISTILFLALDVLIKIINTKVSNEYQEKLQLNIVNHFISIKKIKLQPLHSGDVITHVVNNAIEAIENSLNSIFNMINGILIIMISLLYMGSIQWKITMFLIAYNIVMRIVMTYFEKKIRKNSKKAIEVTKANNSFLVDILTNMLTIKVLGKEQYFNDELLNREKNIVKVNTIRTAWRNGLQDGMWAAMKFSEYFVLYGFGGYLVFKGETELGTLLAFTIAIDIFTKGINSFTNGLSDKNIALACIDGVNEILEIKEIENEPHREITEDNGVIEFKNVCFGFSDVNILEDISFTIKKNEKIMIRGHNGGGKSTLLNLISGLYRPKSGEIFYGSNNVTTIHLDHLTKKYAYISQNSNILEGDVYQNMALSMNYDLEKCDNILGRLHIDKTVDTPSKNLSQGEKQRLNIGRAMYRLEHVCIVLGDEIFSNIDKENTDFILGFLNNEIKDKTVIMVCHDSIDYKFDKIFHVENGSVSIYDGLGAEL